MNTRIITSLFICALLALVSCKTNDNIFTPKISTQINIVNASADTLNFYVNGTRKNNGSSLYPGGQTFYLTVPAGAQSYQFKKSGSPTVLLSVPLNLKGSVYTSLYIGGESLDKVLNTTDHLILDSGLVQLRFVHAAPDIGNLDVTIGDTLKFSTYKFITSSNFLAVGSGQKEIKVYQTGLSTPKIDTIIALFPNHGYTIFAKGLLNGKGSSKLSIGVALNF